MHTLRLLVIALVAALWANSVQAVNTDLVNVGDSFRTHISGGFICDTYAEVDVAIEVVEGRAAEAPGCGMLRQMVMSLVTLMDIRVIEDKRWLFVEYQIPKSDGSTWFQYGVWGAGEPINAEG